MRHRMLPPLAAAAVLAAATFVPAQKPPGKLTIELALEMESVASPKACPTGDAVVFTRSWADKVNDKRKSALWILPGGGEEARFLAEGSDPEWSPDGRRLAFLAEGEPRGNQIHVMWVATREVTQITRVEEPPSNLAWSPDGKLVAFAMNVPEKETFKIKLPEKPKEAKWAPDPKVISRLQYRRDGQGYRPAGWRHLFVVEAGGGTPRQITDGDFDHGSPEWTPDGRKLVFSGLRTDDADWKWRESEIYAVDALSGEVTQLTRRAGPDQGPRVSPDGKRIAWTGFEWTRDTYEVARLWVMNADGSDVRCLTNALDREPANLHWAPDSTGVYFTADSEGRSDIHFARMDGKVSAVSDGFHQVALADVHPRDGRIYGVVRAPHEPGDVFVLRDRRPEPLTRVNRDVLGGVKLGDVEDLRWKSADGLEIQGWLVKPPDFDPARKWPLILQIHGGPHAMYGIGFDFERQNHAAEGYVVLYANPRGSTGYGKSFGNAIDNAYPGKDYDDLMAGVDAVIARGFVDEERLFVYGGSGGGVLTAWIVGKTGRFRAAVSMFPVIDWVSFVGTTDGIHWYNNFRKLPWEDITEHWERSPLRLAGNVTTPTLLITGELDLRTPMSQSEEYYQALKYRKVDTALVRIPDEYHGAAARHPSNQLRRILYVREWFRKHDPKTSTVKDADPGNH